MKSVADEDRKQCVTQAEQLHVCTQFHEQLSHHACMLAQCRANLEVKFSWKPADNCSVRVEAISQGFGCQRHHDAAYIFLQQPGEQLSLQLIIAFLVFLPQSAYHVLRRMLCHVSYLVQRFKFRAPNNLV